MGASVSRWFPATNESVAEVRQWVSQVVTEGGHGEVASTVELLVSELATNAIWHAGGDRYLVEVDLNGHVVAAVCDADPTAPVPLVATTTETSGRGLAIVEALSERWGAQIHRDGKCVWFQLAADPPTHLSAERPTDRATIRESSSLG
jgi:anti-sigma regulatory factor (Ser/Thr protein kinase)